MDVIHTWCSCTLSGNRLTLYEEPLPNVDEFIYLGMSFHRKGLYAPGIMSLCSAGAVKTMTLLNPIGVNCTGFCLLLLLSPLQELHSA